MLKLQNKMVTIHVKLVHMLPTISTQNPAICLCVCVSPQLHKALNQKKQQRRSTCLLLLSHVVVVVNVVVILVASLGEGPLFKCNPVFCVAAMWQKSLFLFFGKERVQGGKRKRSLILFFSFLFLP